MKFEFPEWAMSDPAAWDGPLREAQTRLAAIRAARDAACLNSFFAKHPEVVLFSCARIGRSGGEFEDRFYCLTKEEAELGAGKEGATTDLDWVLCSAAAGMSGKSSLILRSKLSDGPPVPTMGFEALALMFAEDPAARCEIERCLVDAATAKS